MDASWVQGAAAIVAVGSAALLGGMASRIVGAWRRRIRHRAAVVEGSSALQAGRAPAVGEEGVDARIVAYAVELSQRARSPLFRFLSPSSLRAVSYTHLDVYKRQAWSWPTWSRGNSPCWPR